MVVSAPTRRRQERQVAKREGGCARRYGPATGSFALRGLALFASCRNYAALGVSATPAVPFAAPYRPSTSVTVSAKPPAHSARGTDPLA